MKAITLPYPWDSDTPPRLLDRGFGKLLEDRTKLLQTKGVSTFEEYNQIVDPQDQLPYCLVMVDEVMDTRISDELGYIAVKGRTCGVGVIAVYHVPDSLKPYVRSAMRFTIALGRGLMRLDSFHVEVSPEERILLERLTDGWLAGRGVLIKSGGPLIPVQVARAHTYSKGGLIPRGSIFTKVLTSFPSA
jgi:hypothetical protein